MCVYSTYIYTYIYIYMYMCRYTYLFQIQRQQGVESHVHACSMKKQMFECQPLNMIGRLLPDASFVKLVLQLN